jgi:hypothetical protein
MRIRIVEMGNVGSALGSCWTEVGHEVIFGAVRQAFGSEHGCWHSWPAWRAEVDDVLADQFVENVIVKPDASRAQPHLTSSKKSMAE